MIKHDSKWSKTILNDRSWFKIIQNDRTWCKIISNDRTWLKIIQNDQTWLKITHHDTKWNAGYTNEVRVQICKKAKKYLELIQIRFVLSQTRREGILSGADKGTL